MRIELCCAVCGKNRFSLTEADNDSSIVSCKDCGHEIGTLGDLQQKVTAAVLEQSTLTPGAYPKRRFIDVA